MILNLKQYNALHLHQKALLLENGAVFVDHHNSCGFIYTLFSYNRYFIEVTVTSETHDLMNITAFKKGKKLDKYLNEVSLSEIL
jgi:hypothetical protein